MPLGRWQPTRFVRFEQAFDTSVGTSIVVTDAGKTYLKALGNRQGPHALACEWVGTRLADWLGLATFDYALLTLDENDEIPMPRGFRALPGPAFVTRAESGNSWGGDGKELETLANPSDISRLVVFDTWTRNCDRHSGGGRRVHHDNVFFSREGSSEESSRLIAMDHTHCFTCGRDLNASVAYIETVQDPQIFGLFPAFVPFADKAVVLTTCDRLREMTADVAQDFVASVPEAWEVSQGARIALRKFIVERAGLLPTT